MCGDEYFVLQLVSGYSADLQSQDICNVLYNICLSQCVLTAVSSLGDAP